MVKVTKLNFLKQFGVIPIDYSALLPYLSGYKSVRDKIAAFEKKGDLIRLKKGLFVVSPEITGQTISKELIANHLYGPSYVSLETALAFYGLIPERIYTMRSITTKRAKQFTTPFGAYDYTTVFLNYYQIGLRQEKIANQYVFLIATPEKALCDTIITTPRLRIQSTKAMKTYLTEFLRIDLSLLSHFDKKIIQQCIEQGKNKTALTQLMRLLTDDSF